MLLYFREGGPSLTTLLQIDKISGFIAMFEQFYHVSANADKYSEKKRVFEKLKHMVRPISNLNEKRNLKNIWWNGSKLGFKCFLYFA